MAHHEKPQHHDRLSPVPRARLDVNITAVRQLASTHTSVYFESTAAFEQSEKGMAQNWSIWGVVRGRETTLQRSAKGAKRGAGSAVIYISETGGLAVLPNDGNQRDTKNVFTIDGIRHIFEHNPMMMKNIKNALRTNIEHRKKKMIPSKRVLYKRP